MGVTGLRPRSAPAPNGSLDLGRSSPRYGEAVIKGLLTAAAAVTILTTVGIIWALIVPTVQFFQAVSIPDFLFGTEWSPLFADPKFGVLPLVSGTLVITAIACVVAIPLGLLSAIYLSEFAKPKVRRTIKPILEVLAGIPTVIFGFFALEFVTQVILKAIWPDIQVFNALSAGLVMGVMIIPTVASLSEDAMSAVPRSLREAGYALGSSRSQVATRVVVPAALSGIIAAFVLAVSRAIGETMIVAIAAGLQPRLSLNVLEGMQTMTSFIAAAGSGDQPTDSIGYKTIFAVGSLLFAMTFLMNLFSIRLVRKYREVYE
ncbi:MAG: phosphate ABC transporter permease subunit PstC [Candidatus Nanopelagicales bacterium]|nr:phosphate ABC transporter permease subunit PstC [Candidatus Nanopelagicales bacterium]